MKRQRLLLTNILMLSAIIAGLLLTKGDEHGNTLENNTSYIRSDMYLWRFIDIFIASLSLYNIIVHKKYIYIFILFANLYMLYTFNIQYPIQQHSYGSSQHIQLLNRGFLVDGLIIGITLSSIIPLLKSLQYI